MPELVAMEMGEPLQLPAGCSAEEAEALVEAEHVKRGAHGLYLTAKARAAAYHGAIAAGKSPADAAAAMQAVAPVVVKEIGPDAPEEVTDG